MREERDRRRMHTDSCRQPGAVRALCPCMARISVPSTVRQARIVQSTEPAGGRGAGCQGGPRTCQGGPAVHGGCGQGVLAPEYRAVPSRDSARETMALVWPSKTCIAAPVFDLL